MLLYKPGCNSIPWPSAVRGICGMSAISAPEPEMPLLEMLNVNDLNLPENSDQKIPVLKVRDLNQAYQRSVSRLRYISSNFHGLKRYKNMKLIRRSPNPTQPAIRPELINPNAERRCDPSQPIKTMHQSLSAPFTTVLTYAHRGHSI
ncbi:hypothetical protein RRG08_012284 [Elysia crispata]|uniref:Uncharacterized protein n=1 Tax=Elysia crispata TaxID=231223 RepID=A0AAE1ECQ2_9GAST|nr:hypothetical protein RRG08_012284 [Elysia crispata]